MPMENEIHLINVPVPRTLAILTPDGAYHPRTIKGGGPYVVPTWCGNSPEDHVCAWGCMSILQGVVAEHGRECCRRCELYMPDDGEVVEFTTPVLKDYDEYYGYVFGLHDTSKCTDPAMYPAVVKLTHTQKKNEKYGYNYFETTTEVSYPAPTPVDGGDRTKAPVQRDEGALEDSVRGSEGDSSDEE